MPKKATLINMVVQHHVSAGVTLVLFLLFFQFASSPVYSQSITSLPLGPDDFNQPSYYLADYTSIALDASGTPYIAYTSGGAWAKKFGILRTNPTDCGTISDNQTICVGTSPDSFTSESIPTAEAGTLEYHWQKSTTSDAAGFNDISGANATNFTETLTLTQTTWYKRLTKVPCEANWVESNIIEVTINPTHIYVTQFGAALMNGSSWTNAMNGNQLHAAINTQCVTEVWVAAGTYKPTTGTDRNISIEMTNGVAIYGGFPNTGDPDMAERDWVTNVTILSGNIGGVDNAADNSYHVVFNNFTSSNPLNNTAVLDGFTITGGTANGSSDSSYVSGMFNNNSFPSLTNCKFSANSATYGGGMANFDSSPVVTNCILWGNSSGIFNSNSNPTVTYSIVQGGYTGTGILRVNPLFINAADADGAYSVLGAADDGLNLHANNITVSNTNLTGQNTTDDYGMVQFDLSWDNSWRTSSEPNNWDAARVFVKNLMGITDWQQAFLSNTILSEKDLCVQSNKPKPCKFLKNDFSILQIFSNLHLDKRI